MAQTAGRGQMGSAGQSRAHYGSAAERGAMAYRGEGGRRDTPAYRGEGGRRSVYVAGSTARRLDVVEELQRPRRPKELSNAVKKNRDKAVYMNFGYVLFLTASLLVAGVVLINYIQLQSQITTSVKRVASMESELNNLKVANDEEISRIESSIDLDEIRRIAITELGMTYPDESQIVTVPDEGSDYVRQLTDIGE